MKKTMKKERIVLAGIFLCSWFLGVNAQGTSGTIFGTVKDQQGAAVAGASVRIVNDEIGEKRAIPADSDGRYWVSLPPGNYRISIDQQGFEGVEESVALPPARDIVVNFERREPSSRGSRAIVSSLEPLSATIAPRTVRELPLLSRSYDALIPLVPGVIPYTPGAAFGSFEFGAGPRFSAAGGRGYTNSFLLDGTDINDHANGTPGGASFQSNPGIEAVRELTIATGPGNAEYGRASGAVVSAITRSGNNQFHGSAYGYHSNSALNARNFFDFKEPPPYRSHQFGGALGGPIHKDRTFFFVNYEGAREGLKFNNVAVTPVGLAYFSSTIARNGDFGVARVDHKISERTRLLVRYGIDDDSRVIPRPPTSNDFTSARRQYSTIQLNEALRPSLFNSFRFAYNRTAQYMDSLPRDPQTLSFVSGQPAGSIIIGGGFGSSATTWGSNINAPRQWVYNLFQWGDDLSYVTGRHALKFGGNVERIQDNTAENTFVRGALSFSTLTDYLAGRPSLFQVASSRYRGFRQSLLAAYGQDDIRLSSSVTLNLGLRWEAVTDPSEAHGLISNIISPPLDSVKVLDKFFNVSKKNFEPRAGLAWQLRAKTILRAGAAIYHDQLLPFLYARNVSGLPPFSGRLVLFNPSLSMFPIAAGTQPLPACSPSVPAPCSIFSFTTMSWQNKTPANYRYHFGLEQQLFKGAVLELAYIGSTANHLWRRAEVNSPAAEVCSDPAGCISGGVLPATQRAIVPQGTLYIPSRPPVVVNGVTLVQRPNPYFGSIQLLKMDSNSNYHALQVSARRASASGLQFGASYTFSKSIDDNTSMAAGDIATEPVSTLVPNDLRRNRALSALHAKHHSVFYASYPFPFRSGDRVLGQFIGGWKVNAIGTFISGRPFTVFAGPNISGTGDPNAPDRPSLNRSFTGPVILGTPEHYFDPRAFSMPAAGTFGNVGRNTLTGPSFADLDLSVEKAFPVRENVNVQFRAEFFNAINHTNFGQPIGTVFSGNAVSYNEAAGLITSTASPARQIQFGLKIVF